MGGGEGQTLTYGCVNIAISWKIAAVSIFWRQQRDDDNVLQERDVATITKASDPHQPDHL